MKCPPGRPAARKVYAVHWSELLSNTFRLRYRLERRTRSQPTYRNLHLTPHFVRVLGPILISTHPLCLIPGPQVAILPEPLENVVQRSGTQLQSQHGDQNRQLGPPLEKQRCQP